MGRHSSSDSTHSRESSSKRRKKKKSRKRSRSPSPERHRRFTHSKSRKRKSRSRSRDSDRGDVSSRRKRSSSRDRHRRSSRRSRSRSKKRSRSRERSHERRSKKKSRDRSPSPIKRKKHDTAVLGAATGTLKDVMESIAFSKLSPAEQSKIRIQKALQAAVESSSKDDAERGDKSESANEPVDTKDQIDRLKAIQAIGESDESDDDQFIPTHFKSSVKMKQKQAQLAAKKATAGKTTFTERESTHELAIFGHSGMLSLTEALQRKKEVDDVAISKAKQRVDFSQRDPATLVGKQMLVSAEVANERWQDKLRRLRSRFLGSSSPMAS